jgi:hypothetical protein
MLNLSSISMHTPSMVCGAPGAVLVTVSCVRRDRPPPRAGTAEIVFFGRFSRHVSLALSVLLFMKARRAGPGAALPGSCRRC